tara:strand:- start:2474 stop:2713 length:240 start_codon:yes stop_codon:yes gene_type:complete
MSKIILYTMEGCPYCIKLVNLLNEKGLPFEEREISHFREEFDKLKKDHSVQTVPTAIVNGKVIVGSDKLKEIENEYKNS